MIRHKNKTIIVLGLLAWTILAIVFGRYDLQISQALYHPDLRWADAFENGGRMATPILLAVCIHLLICFGHREQPKIRYKVLNIVVFIAVILGIMVFSGGMYGVMQEIVLLLVYLCLLCAVYHMSHRLTKQQIWQIKQIIQITIMACAITFLVVSVVKNCAGRVRFREMTELNQFTPWYRFNWFSGHTSFPSGHTANSSTVLAFVLVAGMVSTTWKKIILRILPFAYLLAMSISRVIVGAHYASDVLFAFGIAVLIYSVVTNLFYERKYGLKAFWM